jgi:hypothetical protein
MSADPDEFTGFITRNARLLRQQVREHITATSPEFILHPLGFYFARLALRGETSIRLHYWSPDHRLKGTAITPYHDHVWSLCSCVLAGAVENVLLDLDPDESGDFQVADIDQIGNVDKVIPASSRVRIRIRLQETHRAGTFYEIPPRVFHYTNVQPEDAALTAVLSRVVATGGPRTLLPVGSAGHMPSRDLIPDSGHVLREIADFLSNSEI